MKAMENSKGHVEKSAADALGKNSSKAIYTKKRACAIFTLADAKQILGNNAKGGASNGNTSSDDLAVSTCAYTQDSGSNNVPVTAGKSASLLVRSPKSAAGITSNQAQFGPAKPADAQAVAGYGDSAYWDPQYGQLDILKNNTWYILSNGPTTPSARSLDQAKLLADIIIDRM
jgi:hypothetical protein